jgi:hypothetical protein
VKYIIAIDPQSEYILPTVFPEEVTHALIGLALNHKHRFKIASAGFVYFDGENWTVPMDRPSISLKIGPTRHDEALLNLFLKQGMAGLELKNMMSYIAIQAIQQAKEGGKPCSLPGVKPLTPKTGIKKPKAGS